MVKIVSRPLSPLHPLNTYRIHFETCQTSWGFLSFPKKTIPTGCQCQRQPGQQDPGETLVKHLFGVFRKIGVAQNGWFIMENPIKMDDLGVPLFLETSIWQIMIFKNIGRIHCPWTVWFVSRRIIYIMLQWKMTHFGATLLMTLAPKQEPLKKTTLRIIILGGTINLSDDGWHSWVIIENQSKKVTIHP